MSNLQQYSHINYTTRIITFFLLLIYEFIGLIKGSSFKKIKQGNILQKIVFLSKQ